MLFYTFFNHLESLPVHYVRTYNTSCLQHIQEAPICCASARTTALTMGEQNQNEFLTDTNDDLNVCLSAVFSDHAPDVRVQHARRTTYEIIIPYTLLETTTRTYSTRECCKNPLLSIALQTPSPEPAQQR
jgi:hypothetical protein